MADEVRDVDSLESKMKKFIDTLNKEREIAHANKAARQRPEHKLGLIKKMEKDAKEHCAAEVVCKIYRDALPLDEEYRDSNKYELDEFFIKRMKQRNPKSNGMYDYITDCAHKGSKPAKMLVEEVDGLVRRLVSYYYENMDTLDTEDIELGLDSKDVADGIDDVTTKMNYDEISGIIENNVRTTVQREIENTKKEDEVLKSLQDSMKADNSVATESAIDKALTVAGFDKPKVYEPSLFNGILIGKITEITESGDIPDDVIEKKAFFEAVKEYTMLETLHTMSLENIFGGDRQKALGRQYASGVGIK